MKRCTSVFLDYFDFPDFGFSRILCLFIYGSLFAGAMTLMTKGAYFKWVLIVPKAFYGTYKNRVSDIYRASRCVPVYYKEKDVN